MNLMWNNKEKNFNEYKYGDYIPENKYPYAIIKMHLDLGDIIELDSPKIPKIKLSISVMAHPSRSKNFPYLREKLGEVPFSIDQKNNLIENCKAAWMMHDPKSDFHVVIQDDAIICHRFKERAEQFITDMESERISHCRPVYGYNFFIRPEYDAAKMRQFEIQGYQLEGRNRGGVAVCLPTNQIESMLEFYDTLTECHDDERISLWVMKNKFQMIFPIPSLIDHNDHKPSLVGHNGLNREAYKFIDNEKFVIPKQIHQLWVSDNPAPLKWMQTWREKNPDFLYRLWTEKEIFAEKWENQKLVDYYYTKKMWHGLKDVVQYEILFRYGGVFMDADTTCLLPINELFTDQYDSYSFWENEKSRPGFIQPLLAAVKGSKFAKELIDGLKKDGITGDMEPFRKTGNKYVGEMYKKTAQNVKIFPSWFFQREHFSGDNYTGSEKCYAKHHFSTTLNSYNEGI